MEPEDILKYLFILLFFLPGLFAKKKKKEENRQPDPYENRYEHDDPFEDFRTFDAENTVSESGFGEENPVQVQTGHLDSIPSEEGVSVFSQKQIETALASMAKYEQENNEIEKTAIQSIENGNTISDDSILADFDVQQAVIYSEILSPKYSC